MFNIPTLVSGVWQYPIRTDRLGVADTDQDIISCKARAIWDFYDNKKLTDYLRPACKVMPSGSRQLY